MTNTYVEALLRDMLPLLTQCGGEIDSARSAKEHYYDVKLEHDRALQKVQELESKSTDGLKPDKVEKHNNAVAEAKTKLIIATNDYDRGEVGLMAPITLYLSGITQLSIAR